MPSEIKLPELGENLHGGDVLDVKVSPGDTVAKGQTLVEIEAEKSTVDVPSPLAGQVTKVMVKKGEKVKVGQPVCVIDEKAQAAPSAAPAAKPPEKKSPLSDRAKKAETTAATPAKPTEPAAATGDGKNDVSKSPRPGTGSESTRPAPAIPADRLVPAGPATRRLARELGVDLHQVPGSASGGRVTQEDIKAYVRDLAAGVGMGAARAAAPPPLPDFGRWGPIEHRPLDGVRRKTADQMSLAWSVIPHVTQHDEADITDLDAFRRQQSGTGAKLTVTAFALKAAVIALKRFPQCNSSLDLDAGRLILKNYYHLGVAVDTERGLLVPVLRDVDKKNVQQLAQELTDLADRARQKKIQLDDMRGGTFTITNLGGIGGTAFTPIVNYPEVAILGLSRGRLQPVIRDGQVVPRLILPLSLSYDHRVIDGADAARFTRLIAEMLENPWFMVLHA